MNRTLLFLLCGTIAGLVLADFQDGGPAALLVAVLVVIASAIIKRYDGDHLFLLNIFFVAIIVRLGFGIFLHVFELRSFFGGDALTYDFLAVRLVEIWNGAPVSSTDWLSQNAIRTSGPGWGMTYLTAGLYYIFGRNMLAVQSFCGFFGAATAPLSYVCAHQIFQNRRVAKVTAILVAVFPAFIIWSSQLLKDGMIIFLLVLVMTMVVRLQKQLTIGSVSILITALFGVLALRFYIFYMLVVAVAGSFVLGLGESVRSLVRGFLVLSIVGIGLTYLGVLRNASVEIDRFGSLESLQNSRNDLARSADSGYGAELDVSTAEGAISVIPLGVIYLMLAPFPWQMANFRQAITLPEVLIWWTILPFAIVGIVYTVRHKLRESIPILIFTLMLIIAYSIFQGNVGTAYRQRTQIQVFLFIFIAVGWSLMQERRENQKILRLTKLKAGGVNKPPKGRST
jgi:hypothetical protein